MLGHTAKGVRLTRCHIQRLGLLPHGFASRKFRWRDARRAEHSRREHAEHIEQFDAVKQLSIVSSRSELNVRG